MSSAHRPPEEGLAAPRAAIEHPRRPNQQLLAALEAVRDAAAALVAFFVPRDGDPVVSAVDGDTERLVPLVEQIARNAAAAPEATEGVPFALVARAEPADELHATAMGILPHGEACAEPLGVVGVVDRLSIALDPHTVSAIDRLARTLEAREVERATEAPPEPAPTTAAEAAPVAPAEAAPATAAEAAPVAPAEAVAVGRAEASPPAEPSLEARAAPDDQPAALVASGPPPAGPSAATTTSASAPEEQSIHGVPAAPAATVGLFGAPVIERSQDLACVLASHPDGLVVCDPSGRVALANAAAIALLGLPEPTPDQSVHYSEGARLLRSDGTPLDQSEHPLQRALAGSFVGEDRLAVDLQAANGTVARRHLALHARPIELSIGRGAMLVARDVTSYLEHEARLMHSGLYDPLTGLATRSLLAIALGRDLARCRREHGVAVLVALDLVGFRAFNDRFGQQAGDELLAAIGARLRGAFRRTDTVARQGSDEFAVVAYIAREDRAVADILAERARHAAETTVRLGTTAVANPVHVAVVTADATNDDPVALLVRAERDLYRQKATSTTEAR